MGNNKEWFGTWFDSEYYHVLYQHRDHEEASVFIDNLIQYLQMPSNSKVMDLACGKGRHSIYLNSMGYHVTGLDLSAQNIKIANQSSNKFLNFHEHDMRHVFQEEAFDFVFNMFTSFGYFDNSEENFLAIEAVAKSLKPKGKFVLDFLNPYTVIHNLVSEETKKLNGINFHIKKFVDDRDFIIKDIHFFDQGKEQHYQEKVKAIRRMEFLDYFRRAGLQVKEVFGSYDLSAYNPTTSERMIFIVEK